MYCANCGQELAGNPRFCTNCGAEIDQEDLGADYADQNKAVTTQKPTAAGIICILFGLIVALFGGLAAVGSTMLDSTDLDTVSNVDAETIFSLTFVIGIVLAVGGLFAVAGGITALYRKVWLMSLMGAIVLSIIGLFFYFVGSVPGVLAMIWITMSKREFSQKPARLLYV